MTNISLEAQAEARKLLAKIAETHEWAREKLNDWGGLKPFYVPLADLEVAAWRAALHCTEANLHCYRVAGGWAWFGDTDTPIAMDADPRIAVFKAVLVLSKEKADERQS